MGDDKESVPQGTAGQLAAHSAHSSCDSTPMTSASQSQPNPSTARRILPLGIVVPGKSYLLGEERSVFPECQAEKLSTL